MARKKINPPATLLPRPGDEYLDIEALGLISLFASERTQGAVEQSPGTVVLRSYQSGETIVRQGDAGWTAFYILSAAEVVAVRENQLHEVEERRGTLSPDEAAEGSELDALREELERELAVWRQRSIASAAAENGRRQVATVLIELNLAPKARRSGFLGRLVESFTGGRGSDKTRPRFIPNDGPADIPLATRRDGMFEGDLFGEMSCMGRVPRSATVVADEECYVLEMLRNILERVRKDEKYRQRTEDDYRRRALGPQLRKLPVFDMLDDAQFDLVRAKTELVTFESGQVVFDEGEPSDAFYVIRGGLVKVVKGLHYLLHADDLPAAQWTLLVTELAALGEEHGGAAATVWNSLDANAQDAVRRAAAAPPGSVGKSSLREIESAVNGLITGHAIVEKLGSKRADLLAAVDDPRAETVLESLPDKVKEWNDLERREFHRWLLETLCPRGLPKRQLAAKDSRTLTYLGRGDFFGEAGVLLNQPRGATCVAFGHPGSGDGAAPSPLELVRIGIHREELERICASRPALKARFDDQIELYKKRDRAPAEDHRAGVEREITMHPRFEELGLIQGQKLMLIDLDRCTRCGDCVQACIRVHDDGASRLFLDGPRFGKYLVPNACRKCLDPVCMIGCPVGSIIRGGDGEIEIKDWCIGCGLCADNCPYGSIHMNRLVDLELGHSEQGNFKTDRATAPEPLADEKYETREVTERAVVCDLCSGLSSKEPACVYHCPHDAAIRIDARYEFPVG